MRPANSRPGTVHHGWASDVVRRFIAWVSDSKTADIVTRGAARLENDADSPSFIRTDCSTGTYAGPVRREGVSCHASLQCNACKMQHRSVEAIDKLAIGGQRRHRHYDSVPNFRQSHPPSQSWLLTHTGDDGDLFNLFTLLGLPRGRHRF